MDLDGAVSGAMINLDIIKDIANSLLIPTQLGGGIRHPDTIEKLLKFGIERIILSTTAVENPEMVKEVCLRFGESIIVSIDTMNGFVATHGWRKETDLKALEFAKSMIRLGIKRFIYTDIFRDGTLTEPNFTAISELITSTKVPIIASGGISSINHLIKLKQLGAEGAIVGKALYTGDIILKNALDAIA